MATAQEGDQRLLDHLALAKDDLADPPTDQVERAADGLDFGHEIFRRGVDRSGRQTLRPFFELGGANNVEENTPEGKFSTVPLPKTAASGVVDCGDFDIRIARNGVWYYRGSPIDRLPLVKLFASALRREADGRYWLVTPAERGRIEVDDVPFLAVVLTASGRGRRQRLMLRTNLDEIVTAGPGHPLRVESAARGATVPYILVRDGLEARLSRAVFLDLVERGSERRVAGGRTFGVWSDGVFFRLGEPGPDWE
jgi:hypothetical protein